MDICRLLLAFGGAVGLATTLCADTASYAPLPEQVREGAEQDRVLALHRGNGSLVPRGDSRMSRSLGRAVSANETVLDKMKDKSSRGWKFDHMRTTLSVSASGLVGILTLKGTPTFRLYWRKKKKKTAPKVEPMRPQDIALKPAMTREDLAAALGPAYRTAAASGRVRDKKKFRQQLMDTAEDFRMLLGHLDELPIPGSWTVRSLRFDITAGAQGMVAPFATLGGDLRFRFLWRRIHSKGVQSPGRAPMAAPTRAQQRRGRAMIAFLGAMLEDLERASRGQYEAQGFGPSQLRVGLGVTVKGDLFMVKSMGTATFSVIFGKRKDKGAARSPKIKPARFVELGAPVSARDVKLAKRLGVAHHRESMEAYGSRTERLLYRIERKHLRKGLARSFKMGNYILSKAVKPESRKGSWEMFKLDQVIALSLTGSVGVASLTGEASAKVVFDKKEGLG